MREGHKYDANNNEYLDSLGLDVCLRHPDIIETMTSQADDDINPAEPICIGMDYNANINWIVAGQPSGRRLNVLKSFFVKFERKIPALVDDFCRYYAGHANKTVVYYFDSTALGSNYAVNEQDFRWVVIHEFECHGWRVEAVYLSNPMHHEEKHLLINQGFADKQRLMPFFNRSNNEDLILAIQSAGVSNGRNGLLPLGRATSWSAKTSQAKNSPNPKKTCSNTARTAPMHSILSTSAVRNFRSTKLSPSPLPVCFSQCTRQKLFISLPRKNFLPFRPIPYRIPS